VYSIANFSTLRCLEQIRNDVCYHDLPVTLVSVGSGVSYGALGYTHHAIEEISAIRALPNITIGSPCDPIEADLLTRFFAHNTGPGYLRLGKNGEPNIHSEVPVLKLGKAIKIRPGSNRVVLTTGSIASMVLEAVDEFKYETGEDVETWVFPFIKPLDIDALSDIATRAQGLLTVEEHVLSGGFGSSVLEALSKLRISNLQVFNIGLNETPLTAVGSAQYIREQRGLSKAAILQELRRPL